MRIYVSDGKVFAELDETIEVCKCAGTTRTMGLEIEFERVEV